VRICSIAGENLASLEGRFVVDFETGPLAGAGLFGITGPTGAGKTTLLDAMSLALFDATPRLRAAGRARIGLESDAEVQRLSESDVRSLVRKEAVTASAEVKFIGRDGRRYHATWSVKRAREKVTGQLQKQELELRDDLTGQVLGGTKTETLAAIELALGLDFDQFKRSVVLAQGEFAAFLKAEPDDRAALLEKMTGTAIYSGISRAAFTRAKEAWEALARLQEQRTASPPLTAEVRAERESERARLEAELADAQAHLEAAAKAARWFELADGLEREAQAAAGALAAATQAWEAAAGRREALAEVRRAEQLRPAFEAWRAALAQHEETTRAVPEAELRLAQARARLELGRATSAAAGAALQASQGELAAAGPALTQARGLDTRLAAKRQELAGKQGRAKEERDREAEARQALAQASGDLEHALREGAELDETLAAQAPLARLSAAFESIRTGLQAAREPLTMVRSAAGGGSGLTASEAAAEARRTLAGARQLEAEARCSRAEVKEALAASGRSGVEGAQARVSERQRALAELVRVHEAWLERLGRRERALGLAGGHRADAVRASASAALAREQLASLVSARESQAAATAELEAILGLAAERGRLEAGKPCPLCGALEHPLSHLGGDLEARLAGYQARGRELEGQERTLQGALAKHGTDADGGEGLAARADQEALEAQHLVAETEAAWARLAPALEAEAPASPGDPAAPTWLDAEREALAATAAALRARLEACRQLDERAQSAEGAEHLATAAVRAAELVLGLEERLEAVANPLDFLAGWRADFLADAGTFVRSLEGRVEGWRAAERRRVQLAEAAQALAQRRTDRATAAGHLAASSLERRREADETEGELLALGAQRREVLAGQPAEAVEGRLLAAVAKAREASLGADAELVRVEPLAREAEDGLTRAASRLAVHGDARERTRRQVDAALAAAGLAEGQAAEHLARGQAWLGQESAAQEALELAVTTTRGPANDRARRRAEHEVARPGGWTPTSAQEEHAKHALAVATGQQRQGRLQQVLEDDDAARARDLELGAQVEAQASRAEVWGQLRDLIGSHDGKAFRTFAQGLTFGALLEATNEHLRDLAPRYGLMRVPRADLEMQVVDHDRADEPRSTSSLSGGETFLVSLALALGLSSLGASGTRVESLFIDEGFGSLDSKSLDAALDVLEGLQATGRTVGIISHVEGLDARLGAKVRVVRTGTGRSRVETVR
jgi:exonuclease SbcC